ncbi:NEDD4-binding protein 2 [Physocladia obscura]|uniref:NEDD4-binding protein 2 n=1 Tax=Physocladia obscura TaxID=109957 RepID=A0AAD5SY36_9FUNG|nr:NEDD4-binding protein 2 [Physocladia obscura]
MASPNTMAYILVIMRGCSGSGKSTRVNQLISERISLWPLSKTAVFSTDDFWLVPDPVNPSDLIYKHDISRLSEAHVWNQARAINAMQSRSADYIVIDNTNLCRWEAKPYVEAAIRHNFSVEVYEPQTPWWIARDPDELFARSTHGVPHDAILKMLERYETDFSIDAILASSLPQRNNNRNNRNNSQAFNRNNNNFNNNRSFKK